jgi:8-oxo-dGTP diphosphatase
MRKTHAISVKGLCMDDDGRILVIREPNGTWELPGGGLEEGEELIDCLKRECLEEIGVECEVLDQDPYKTWQGQTRTDGKRLIILFKIRLKSHNFKQTEEAEEVRFVTKEELNSLDLVPQLNPLKDLLG